MFTELKFIIVICLLCLFFSFDVTAKEDAFIKDLGAWGYFLPHNYDTELIPVVAGKTRADIKILNIPTKKKNDISNIADGSKTFRQIIEDRNKIEKYEGKWSAYLHHSSLFFKTKAGWEEKNIYLPAIHLTTDRIIKSGLYKPEYIEMEIWQNTFLFQISKDKFLFVESEGSLHIIMPPPENMIDKKESLLPYRVGENPLWKLDIKPKVVSACLYKGYVLIAIENGWIAGYHIEKKEWTKAIRPFGDATIKLARNSDALFAYIKINNEKEFKPFSSNGDISVWEENTTWPEISSVDKVIEAKSDYLFVIKNETTELTTTPIIIVYYIKNSKLSSDIYTFKDFYEFSLLDAVFDKSNNSVKILWGKPSGDYFSEIKSSEKQIEVLKE